VEEESEGYELNLKDQAISDIRRGYEWHFDEEPSWGEDFLEEVEKAQEYITQLPRAYPNKYKDYREYHLERYPYVVIYNIKRNEITVFSVFHTSRDPGEKYPE